jgi:carbonic anhydrase/acetyltransferase-like protein (isoleucine patch superfamily)/bifunctional DNA-binding transcriptional regulator/antitoxin component of YhaV-PrlF toxin-antitoxin module
MDAFEVVIDEAGRVMLPPEVREQLGWKPGAVLAGVVEASGLRLSRREPRAAPGPPVSTGTSTTATLKEQARRLADAMRGIADTKEVRSVLSSIGLPAPSPERRGAPASPEASRQVAPSHPLLSPPSVGESNVPVAPSPPDAAPSIRAFGGQVPEVPESCYVDPSATLIGAVILGEGCSVWPGAVLRGDVGPIRIGACVNIQDGAVLHTHPERAPVLVGDGVTIGHGAVLHGCTIGEGALIGIRAVVLDGARVGEGAIVGAGSVVTHDVPPGAVVVGNPARVVRYVGEEAGAVAAGEEPL